MTADDPVIGRRLADRYRIDALIARGGMARVYRARDERLERDVAVKILSAPYADDPEFTARFLEEARAAASLSHPSLVHVYDSGTDGRAHFIVMELLDRHRSLREALESGGPMSREEVLRIGRELLAGLAVVHDRGLVHCDVKAANVMLGPGPAKLIDFGIARAPHGPTEGDTSIGSLQSMSPEQLHGEALTPASDLFSVGVVLYQALTGRLPFPGRTPEEVSAAQRAGNVAPPSALTDGISGRLDDVILQALQREPASRFHSADAMRRALEAAERQMEERHEDETQVIGAPPSSGYVPPPVSRPPPAAGARRPRRRGPGGLESGLWSGLGTALVLGAAALVIVLVVVPLLELGRGAGGGEGTPSPSAAATAAPAGNTVEIPNMVGRPTDEAIELARQLGLDWTVRCAQDPAKPEGIIDQEPPAGQEVRRGSTFTMYSARIADCRD